MQFIEHWFGFSPDAGSGTTELLYVLVIAAAILVFMTRAYLRKRARQNWQ
jgi:hypothetical protein